MAETQWFLSVLGPRDRYLSLSGSRLSGTRTTPDSESRATTLGLASAISIEFNEIRQDGPERFAYDTPDIAWFEDSVNTIRDLLGIAPTSSDVSPSIKNPDKPALHEVGYSLGGFVAQSIFMTWPFIISSCSTICSGGALNDITPVGFAHPEEWQTLTHSLRYRVDALLESIPESQGEPRRILGLRVNSFDYFKRVFYEVFEQAYRASYQSRVEEYLQRMIFVVGGNDPVVRPEAVLDAAPDANVIEVGGLTHFVSSSKTISSKIEREQRKFWFQEIARVLAHWAPETERVWLRALEQGWRTSGNTSFALQQKPSMGSHNVSDKERSAIEAHGSVGSPLFERLLDAMTLKMIEEKGVLFILRNEIPSFMLADEFLIFRGKALHHSEEAIRGYLDGVAARRAELQKFGRGVVIAIPHDAVERFRDSFRPGLSFASQRVVYGSDPL